MSFETHGKQTFDISRENCRDIPEVRGTQNLESQRTNHLCPIPDPDLRAIDKKFLRGIKARLNYESCLRKKVGLSLSDKLFLNAPLQLFTFRDHRATLLSGLFVPGDLFTLVRITLRWSSQIVNVVERSSPYRALACFSPRFPSRAGLCDSSFSGILTANC